MPCFWVYFVDGNDYRFLTKYYIQPFVPTCLFNQQGSFDNTLYSNNVFRCKTMIPEIIL